MAQEQIEQYFSAQEETLVQAISRLVSIESTLGEAAPGKPFGPGPAAALDEALRIAEEWGLAAQNLEGYVGAVDLNDQPTHLHILGHLDVVDGGEGWTATSPFTPKRVGDLLYGRGVSDDKGPMMAALLAMKAVKDLGLPLKSNARIIFGTDEETGFRDIHWYYDRHPYAPHTISPDADFPIINIEKGHYQPTFTASWPQEGALPRVSSAVGGARVNMVPPKAKAVVLGLTEEQARAALPDFEAEISFSFQAEGDKLVISCAGQNAHGSTPEEGHNAQTALVALLARLPLADCPSTKAIQALAERFPHGDHRGKALGIAQEDDLSGPLTLAFTCLDLTETGLTARFDSRTPLCGSDENIRLPVEKVLGDAGFTVTGKIDPPHHIPADDPFLTTLGKCYTQYTGQPSQCLAIGGGTYVHDIPGGVAFGANMPGFQPNIHGADECVPVKDLLTAAKIFTQVILDVCG